MTLAPIAADSRSFAVEYDGPGLADHSIPVRDFAPSLLALGQAFDRANVIINGNRSSVSLEILATQQSSFEVALILKQVIDGASGFVTSDFLASAADLVEIVGGSAISVGLLGLLRRLHGEQPRVIERAQRVVTIVTPDGVITASTRILDLYQDGASATTWRKLSDLLPGKASIASS